MAKVQTAKPSTAAAHRTYSTVGLGDAMIADLGSWYRLLTDGRTWLVNQLNAGKPGTSTTAQIRSRASAALASHPDVLVIEGGTDDFLSGISLETTVRNLLAIIDQAKAAHVQVIISTVPPSDEMPAAVGPTNDAIRLLGLGQTGVTLVDGNGPIINSDGSYRAGMTTDKRHPNPVGYALMADSIDKQLARTPFNGAAPAS